MLEKPFSIVTTNHFVTFPNELSILFFIPFFFFFIIFLYSFNVNFFLPLHHHISSFNPQKWTTTSLPICECTKYTPTRSTAKLTGTLNPSPLINPSELSPNPINEPLQPAQIGSSIPPSHHHKLKCQCQSQYVSCKIHPCISLIWI